MPSFLVDLLSRLNRWPRRVATLVCVALAAASALAARRTEAAHRASTPDGTPVVVAAHDLGVGIALARRDLATVAWPRELVPAGTSKDPGGLVGRRLAGPVHKREAVTSTRLVGADLSAGLPAGEVATAVSINPALATLVHPGDHIDVLAAPVDGGANAGSAGSAGRTDAVLVAEAAAVLAVLPVSDGDGVPGGAQVLVATDRGTAVRLVALQTSRVLAVVLSPP
ncbi:MAG: Flp pilus assembly protein CpaB [Actinomycetota bacterium]|nr:Flp pilus assembly protein CpaB [Actinomycetota bacterium]